MMDVEDVPAEFLQTDFTSIAFTQHLGAPYNTYLVVLGASDGSMTAFDHKTQTFVENGVKKWAISGEIGHIRVKNSFVVLASSTGTVARYNIAMGHVFPEDKAV
jgi:hypothetical protein